MQAFGGEGTKDKFIWVSTPQRTFTAEEINLLAGQYETVIIGNAHGDWTKENYQTEAGRLKAVNANVKVFPYYNSKFHFLKDKRVDPSQGFLDNWYLKDKSGNIIPKEEGAQNYYLDLTKEDYRDWIVEKISTWISDGNIDGIALDGVSPLGLVARRDWVDKIGENKLNQWNEGLELFIKEVKAAVGDKKVIYNGILPSAGGVLNLQYLNNATDADYAFNEVFCYNRRGARLESKDRILELVDAMINFRNRGKGFMQKVNFYPPPDNPNPTPPALNERNKIARFCLGAFLMGYQPGLDSFKFGPGYRVDMGEFNEITDEAAEMRVDLGEPAGEYRIKYKFTGDVYRRKFDNGWVYMNFSDTRKTISSPDNLILANGGVKGRSFNSGDDINIPAKDAVFLVEREDLIAPLPTATTIPSPTVEVSPSLTVTPSPTGPTPTRGPRPSPTGSAGNFFNYNIGSDLQNIISSPFVVVGGIILFLFFL